MNNKPALILDCDGVLYPVSMLSLKEFVGAMQKTYDDFHISKEVLDKASAITLKRNHQGMFNYIKAVCDSREIPFNDFCNKMFEHVNYKNIKEDKALLADITAAARTRQVVILTNNTNGHLDKVLHQRFGISVFEMENHGIECYDITATERNGVFYPKQNPKALELFANKIGRLPEDCILVDDTQRNLDSAASIGMKTALISKHFSLKQFLAQETGRKILTTERENG